MLECAFLGGVTEGDYLLNAVHRGLENSRGSPAPGGVVDGAGGSLTLDTVGGGIPWEFKQALRSKLG